MSRKTKKKAKPRIVDVDHRRLEELLQRAESHSFESGDYETIRDLLESYSYLTDAVGKKSTTIARLRELLFGTKSESRANLPGPHPLVGGVTSPHNLSGVDEGGIETTPNSTNPSVPPHDSSSRATPPAKPPAKAPAKGHGRLSAEDYVGATTINVAHPFLIANANCPECSTGTVYRMQPNVVVRISGHAPLSGTVYELEKWRCNLCGTVFATEPPANIGTEKYDAESAAIIGVLKYGTGMPFNRLAAIQDSVGVPVPAATQWKIVEEATRSYEPVYETLLDQAAQGEVLYNDDTTMKILERMGKRAVSAAEPAAPS